MDYFCYVFFYEIISNYNCKNKFLFPAKYNDLIIFNFKIAVFL